MRWSIWTAAFAACALSACNDERTLGVSTHHGAQQQDQQVEGALKATGMMNKAEVLTAEIKNPKARLLKKEGMVEITFDYESQLWSLNPEPLSLFIWYVDRADHDLMQFATQETYVSEAAASDHSRIDETAAQVLYGSSIKLKARGNVIRYPIPADKIEHLSKVVFGFYSDRVTSRDAFTGHDKKEPGRGTASASATEGGKHE